MPNETAVIDAPPQEGNIPPDASAALDRIAAGVFGSPLPDEGGSPAPEVSTETPPPAPPAAAPKVEPTGIPESILNPPSPEATADKSAAPEPKFDVPPEIKSEAGIKSFKELRTRYEETKRTAAGLEAKIKELESKPNAETDPNAQARIQELEQRLAEVLPAFERVTLEAHPDFQRQFTVPEQQMMARGRDLVKLAGLDPAAIDQALSRTGTAQIEAMDELTESITSPTLKTQVINLVANLNQLQITKQQILQDSKGNLERLEAHRRAEEHRQIQEQEQQLGGLLESSLAELREKHGLEFLKKSTAPGTEKWNQTVESIEASARDLLLRNTDMAQAARAAALAAMTPHYVDAFRAERARRIEVEAKLAAIENAEPGLEKGGESTTYTGEAPKTIEDILRVNRPAHYGKA